MRLFFIVVKTVSFPSKSSDGYTKLYRWRCRFDPSGA